MRKATEASAGDEKADIVLKFQQLAKDKVKQDNPHDFICSTMDGNCIALVGSKVELLTLELTNKSTHHLPFPYIQANLKSMTKNRPLDKLAKQANLQEIYDNCNALEMQQLVLQPVYIAINTPEVPDPNLLAASWSPHLLPGGQMLLALLNSYGALELVTKSPGGSFWRHYEKGLDIATTLGEQLQPPYEVSAAEIDTFRHYQSFVDRSWITSFAWRPLKTDSGNYVIVLGTAAGSLWILTLCPEARTVLSHCELHTLLGRICFMHPFEDLLLVGDNNGLVHLYRFNEAEDEGLSLVKPLWLRPDHMGLQQAVISHCPERDCYYIVCCKAAHLLIWCMPRKETGNWLETRFLVGGMKITALCDLGNCSYGVGTARGQLYRIELIHKSAQLSFSKRLIEMENTDNYQPAGVFCSQHKNILTVIYTRNNEYLLNSTYQRVHLPICLGKLEMGDSLGQLVEGLSPNEAIHCYMDILVEVRMEIFNHFELEKYVNYLPLDMFAFDELASQSLLHQLQVKYHIIDALIQVQQYQSPERFETERQLLLAMLATTHIRLRLQHLANLDELTTFQRKAAQCQLEENARIKQRMDQQLQKEKPLNVTIKRFLNQMEIHFEALQTKFGVFKSPEVDAKQQAKRCCISYVELVPDLSQHYCTLCDRQVLIDQQLLLELYEPGSRLLCPFCHGAYKLEIIDT
ncbi:uncharacterized protein LOC117788084 [Drosophila innubila]|uniref:uncharacterized protein LOC117788084 n=1 Tax=Drosophila innubila TaxID=198719 RepID=UPI00148BBB34|nr:uncharacterized protein LOC117788084 [Drosophila innubila]